LNLSPIINAPTVTQLEAGVLQLDLDKPRRGATYRHWPEIFVEGEDDSPSDRRGAQVVRMISEATDPAREFLSATGLPADRLLVYWPSFAGAPLLGLPSRGARSKAAWLPDGMAVDFGRLRRSIPGRGVTREPTDHSPNTHLHYIRTDAESMMEQHEEAALAVQKMMNQASTSLAIRIAGDAETDPSKDSVVLNCADPSKKPASGEPCTTGYFSFLDCLGCTNAATAPRLLPRQMAAIEVLEELRDSTGEQWERRFAAHYYTLKALVDRSTDTEKRAAALKVPHYRKTIIAALRYAVPA
jgi:hypothetical protein